MKKYFLLIFTIFLFAKAFSQDVEHLVTKKTIDCSDIIYNCSLLIPEYFAKNNSDTVAALINYWENHCVTNEPLIRLKILFAINADTLNENIYSKINILNYLSNYRDRIKSQINVYEGTRYYFDRPLIPAILDKFTEELAIKLKQRKTNSELESFFLDFYSNDFDEIFFRLQDTTLANTELRTAYLKELNYELNRPEGHFSIYSGVWIPNGNLNIVGNHPIIGFQAGLKNKRGLMFDIAMEIKFLNSAITYLVEKNDSLYSTNYFFGGFIGLEIGYELMNYKSHELDILGGLGYDGFDALSIGKSNDPNRITKNINALNLNLGIGYRKYLKNKSYIGIETRYNLVNYNNKNGTDLSGNTLTVRLKYGISRNIYRDKRLKQLDHKKILLDKKYYEWLQEDKVKMLYYY